MRILWIGSYASDEMLDKMPSKNIGQASGVTSQRSLLSGMDVLLKDTDVVVDTLNVQGVPVFPKYAKRVMEECWSRNGKSVDRSIGFANTKLKRPFSQASSLNRAAKQWIEEHKDEDVIHVFLYEPVLNRLSAVKTIKKHHSNVRCHLIVPDIPEFVGNCHGKLQRILKQIRKKIIFRRLRVVDDFIFYARNMAEYYGVPRDKFIVMEGSIDLRDAKLLECPSDSQSNAFSLMYSGAITRGRGLPKFFDAFEKYKNRNVEIWFTGGGDFEEGLAEIAKTDSRIKLYGFLPSRKDVLQLETNASALLHIRDKDAISSKYCFPSKLFEYMASGKPVLSVRISGIPDEYYEYLIVMEDLSNDSVASAIDRVFNMTDQERDAFGRRAKDFVINQKNSAVQAQKMLEFAINKEKSCQKK